MFLLRYRSLKSSFLRTEFLGNPVAMYFYLFFKSIIDFFSVKFLSLLTPHLPYLVVVPVQQLPILILCIIVKSLQTWKSKFLLCRIMGKNLFDVFKRIKTFFWKTDIIIRHGCLRALHHRHPWVNRPPAGRADGRAEGVCVVEAKAGPSCPEGQCFQYSLSRKGEVLGGRGHPFWVFPTRHRPLKGSSYESFLFQQFLSRFFME